MNEEPLAPLTLEECEEWLIRLDDVAATERDMGHATRFLLSGLLVELARTGAIDVRRLFADLQARVSEEPEPHYQLAREVLLKQLSRHVAHHDSAVQQPPVAR